MVTYRYCNACRKPITNAVYQYSMDKFKIPLCIEHQKSFSNITPEAKKLYDALIKKGVPAELEKWDGQKHIDIAITKAMINIEVDGQHHSYSDQQALADIKRSLYSFKAGFLTLHVPNILIQNKFDETLNCLLDYLAESREKLWGEEILIRCPLCKKEIDVSDSPKEGDEIECPWCHKELILEARDLWKKRKRKDDKSIINLTQDIATKIKKHISDRSFYTPNKPRKHSFRRKYKK